MSVKPVRTEPYWDQCLYSEYNKPVFIHVILTKISYNVKLKSYRILVYSGFSSYRILAYSGFSLYRILVYSGFSLYRIPVYLGFSSYRIPVYSGFSSYRIPVYSGFSLNRVYSMYIINTFLCIVAKHHM